MAKKPAESVRIGRGFSDVQIRQDSFNEEARTVEIIWAAGAAVKRYSWDEGYYMEELSMDPQHIRLDRFTAGMSLLDSHDSYSMDNRLGSVVPGSVRIEGGKGYATVKLSRKQRAEELMQDLRDGHPFPVSVGYRTHAYEKREGDNNKLPTLRAIDWEPLELSAVPVPADAGAHSRSERSELFDVVIRNDDTTAASSAPKMEKPMKKRDAAKTYAGEQLDALALGAGLVRNENETDEALRVRLLAAYDAEDTAAEAARNAAQQEQQRQTQTDQQRSVQPPAQTVPVNADEVRAAERKRVADINSIGSRAKLSRAAIDKAVNDGTSVETFRAQAFEALASEGDSTAPGALVDTRGGQDERDTMRRAMSNAILHRIGVAKDLLPEAREWRGTNPMEIARECIRVGGASARGSVHDVAKRAFHTTSDFPIIMGEVTRATVLAGYNGLENTFERISNRNVVPDFREAKTLELGSAPDLLPVNEHGEFESGSMKESEESFKIATYGRTIGFTRQMLINDQLDAFGRAMKNWGRKAKKLEGDIVWGVIINNLKLKSDGKALFHADHGNLAASGTALNVASMIAARKAFRMQKDIDGEQIAIAPKFLYVGTDLEIPALQMIAAAFAPTKDGDQTPDFIKSLQVVYEPRLDKLGQYTWLLFADPADVNGRGLQHAYLAGQEEPFYDERVGFEVDGIEYKIRHDFGAGLTDYRFAYKNNGAAPTP